MRFLPLMTALFAGLVASQSSSTATATATAPASNSTSVATVAAGTDGYTFAGCYNETTGVAGTGGARALAGGKMSANETITVDGCIAYCASSGYVYAGLQYGDECWCAQYLNALSALLNQSACDIPCAGNDAELCGGSLTISLYNTSKSTSSSSGKKSAGEVVGVEWRLVVGAGAFAAVVAAVL